MHTTPRTLAQSGTEPGRRRRSTGIAAAGGAIALVGLWLPPATSRACSPALPDVRWPATLGVEEPLVVTLLCVNDVCPSDLELELVSADGVAVQGSVLRTAEGEDLRMFAWKPATPLSEGTYELAFAEGQPDYVEAASGSVAVQAQPTQGAVAGADVAWTVDRVTLEAGESYCCRDTSNSCGGSTCMGETGRRWHATFEPEASEWQSYAIRRVNAPEGENAWQWAPHAAFYVGEAGADGRACLQAELRDLRTGEVEPVEHCAGADIEVGEIVEEWPLLTYCTSAPPALDLRACLDGEGRPDLGAPDCELSAALTAVWCDEFRGDRQQHLDEDGVASYAQLCADDIRPAASDGGLAGQASSGCSAATRSNPGIPALLWVGLALLGTAARRRRVRWLGCDPTGLQSGAPPDSSTGEPGPRSVS